jgi:hypothetical protein
MIEIKGRGHVIAPSLFFGTFSVASSLKRRVDVNARTRECNYFITADL